LRNTLGTLWEQKTQKNPSAHDPKNKQIGPSSIYVEPSPWLHQIFISKTVCHHFSPGLLEGMGCTLYGRIYKLALSLLRVQISNQQHLSQGSGLTGIAPYGDPWPRKRSWVHWPSAVQVKLLMALCQWAWLGGGIGLPVWLCRSGWKGKKK
jgi:hypothetical protein